MPPATRTTSFDAIDAAGGPSRVSVIPHRARGRISGEGGNDVNAALEVKNIVLVHGGFVDGSGWQGVYEHLTADGYRVAVVQNPTLSLAEDAAVTRRLIDT